MIYFKTRNNVTGDERFTSWPSGETIEQASKMLGLDPKTSTIEEVTYQEFCDEVEKVFVDCEDDR
jgi:hypothetical protein